MAFRSVGTAISTPTTNPSVAAPPSVAAGDTIGAFFTADGNGTTMGPPDASWVAVPSSPATTPSGDLQRAWLWLKVATASEPATYNFSSSGAVTGFTFADSGRHPS